MSLIQLAYSMPCGTYHTGRVWLVHHYQCIVFLGKIANLIHWSYIAVHREHTVRNNNTETLCLRFLQTSFHVLHVSVGITVALCLAKTYSVNDRSMVQRIRDDGILFREKRFEYAAVGVETSSIQDRVFRLEILRDGSFQFFVYILCSTNETDGWHSVSTVVHHFLRSLD